MLKQNAVTFPTHPVFFFFFFLHPELFIDFNLFAMNAYSDETAFILKKQMFV